MFYHPASFFSIGFIRVSVWLCILQKSINGQKKKKKIDNIYYFILLNYKTVRDPDGIALKNESFTVSLYYLYIGNDSRVFKEKKKNKITITHTVNLRNPIILHTIIFQ